MDSRVCWYGQRSIRAAQCRGSPSSSGVSGVSERRGSGSLTQKPRGCNQGGKAAGRHLMLAQARCKCDASQGQVAADES